MLDKIRQKSITIIVALLAIVGFLVYRLNYQAKMNRVELALEKSSNQSKIDSLIAANTLSNNLVLAQSSALQLSSGQNLTKYEIENINAKIANVDTANLNDNYQQAIRAVQIYLEDRKSKIRFDSLQKSGNHKK